MNANELLNRYAVGERDWVHPTLEKILRGAYLSQFNLSAFMVGANLSRADLSGSYLRLSIPA